MSDLLVIDGSTTKVITVGDDLGDVSKDAVVFPIAPEVAELIGKLLAKNNLLAQKVAGAGDAFVEQILPLMKQAYFEGVLAKELSLAEGIDEGWDEGYVPPVADPYGDQIRSRNELRGL